MTFFNEQFWIALSFITLVILSYRPLKKSIISTLDSKINEIKEQIEIAAKLKSEAQNTFDILEKEIASFEEQKKNAIKEAQMKANEIVESKTKEMNLQIERMTVLAEKSIDDIKIKACQKIQEDFVEYVILIVTTYLSTQHGIDFDDQQIIKRLIFFLPKK